MDATTKVHGLGEKARFFKIVKSSEDGRTLTICQTSVAHLPKGVSYTDGWLEEGVLKSRHIVNRDGAWGFAFEKSLTNERIIEWMSQDGYTITIK